MIGRSSDRRCDASPQVQRSCVCPTAGGLARGMHRSVLNGVTSCLTTPKLALSQLHCCALIRISISRYCRSNSVLLANSAVYETTQHLRACSHAVLSAHHSRPLGAPQVSRVQLLQDTCFHSLRCALICTRLSWRPGDQRCTCDQCLTTDGSVCMSKQCSRSDHVLACEGGFERKG